MTKTYDMLNVSTGYDAVYKMVEVPCGEWVSSEDFAKLDADAAGVQAELASVKLERHQLRNELTAARLENERLRKDLRECRSHLTDVIASQDRPAIKAAADWLSDWEGARVDPGSPSELTKLPTEAEIDAAFPAVAAGVIAEVQHYSKLSPKEFAELAWSTLIDPAWRHTTMLYELCARASPEWVQERKAAKGDPQSPVEPNPARDADHCDYPDCEQHWTYVVDQVKRLAAGNVTGCGTCSSILELIRLAQKSNAAPEPLRQDVISCRNCGTVFPESGNCPVCFPCKTFVGDGPTYSCLLCGRLGTEHEKRT